MAKNKELGQVRDFVVKKMNTERDEHAQLLELLQQRFDGFSLSDDTVEFLSTLHKFKMEFLQETHDFVQDL